MGITGLLPLLKSIHKPCNLKRFAGQTLGVDAYGWLHRGTVACAVDLALGKPTRKYVDFCLNRVRMLIHFGVTPYLVFDGDYLPSKAATEHERAKRRDESKRFGLEMYHSGKVTAAHKELQKAVDVTPLMARELIEELKSMNVSYIVAPYEADAQLAYLEQKGIISAVLSEDSDLLVFGTKCLLTKLDQYGDCVEINREDFTSCREISLVGWSNTEFRRMAILSGCDYLRGIPKMGLMKAYRLVRKYKDVEKIIRMVQFDGQFCVPPGYSEAFQQAERTFMHQRVFCPLDQKLKLFSEIDGEQPENFDYVGKETDPAVAIEVALGNLDPITKEPLIVKKQKHSTSSPRTPYNARQSSNVENLSSKKWQTIETFFRPKRTPLAELDPNCFTPSPTQLRLQQQQTNVTWQSSTIPVDPAARSVQSAPSSSLAYASSSTPSNTFLHSLTPTLPPKRRRLCDDSLDALGSLPISAACGAKSRFFPAQMHVDGLNTGNCRRRRKQRVGSMNIWSDDSIEDAMANLPDVTPDNGGQLSRRVAVYSEALEIETGLGSSSEEKPRAVTVTQEVNQVANDSEESVISTGSYDSRASTATSLTSVAQEDIPSTLDASIKSDLAALTKTYLYEPTNASEDVERETKPLLHKAQSNADASQALVAASPPVTEQNPSKERLADHLKITPAEYQKALQARRPDLARSNTLTPLKRLGAHALHRTRSYSGPSLLCDQVPSEGTKVPSSAPAPNITEKTKSQTPPEQELPNLVHHRVAEAHPDPHIPCDPERSPLPKIQKSNDALPNTSEGQGALSEAKGSEDLMIPDSEGSDVASISEQGSPRKPKLDLGRFAFCGV